MVPLAGPAWSGQRQLAAAAAACPTERFAPQPQPRTSNALCAEDRELYDLCALRQDQFTIACSIDDMERGIDPQPGLLPSMRSTLAVVHSKLQQAQQRQAQQQQQRQQPAPPAGQDGAH